MRFSKQGCAVVLAMGFAASVVACGGSMHEAARAPSGAPSGGASIASSPADAPSSVAEVAGEVASAPPPPAPFTPSSPAEASAPAAKVTAAADTGRAAGSMPIAAPHSIGGILTAGVWDDAKNFDFFLGFSHRVATRSDDLAIFTDDELATAHEAAMRPHGRKQALDVALVFDTTGSMGDELSYVQREFEAITRRLHERLPEVQPRWSLVVYRDRGDEYVTRSFAFTGDTATFRRTLAAQSAGGGGDYPEAVLEGLRATSALPWQKSDGTAKVAFWVADAPTHAQEGAAFGKAVRALRDQNVHLYPIAASGADDLTEYEMRSAAVMTGGRYVFLTDDSGVGGGHAEPHIPCYAVTRLDRAIVRVLETEVSGAPIPVAREDVLRTTGNPRPDGTCKLASGELVAAF